MASVVRSSSRRRSLRRVRLSLCSRPERPYRADDDRSAHEHHHHDHDHGQRASHHRLSPVVVLIGSPFSRLTLRLPLAVKGPGRKRRADQHQDLGDGQQHVGQVWVAVLTVLVEVPDGNRRVPGGAERRRGPRPVRGVLGRERAKPRRAGRARRASGRVAGRWRFSNSSWVACHWRSRSRPAIDTPSPAHSALARVRAGSVIFCGRCRGGVGQWDWPAPVGTRRRATPRW